MAALGELTRQLGADARRRSGDDGERFHAAECISD
jgi:hypothetical protein